MTYENFSKMTLAQKRTFVNQARADFNAAPGEKIYVNLDQIRCQRMFGDITQEEYERKLLAYGPCCYQFGELA